MAQSRSRAITRNRCSILKFSMHVECHFAHQILFFFVLFWGHFTKMCFAKFPPFTMKTSPKTACHKIQWVRFVNRKIAGLQCRYSSIHFQIPILVAISALQLQLGTDCNFSLASTTIFERGFSKHNWLTSDRKNRLKLETFDALMRVSICDLPMENMDWAKNLTLGNRPKTRGFCLWSWMMIKHTTYKI